MATATQTIKLMNFNANQKATVQVIARAVSQLNAAMFQAIEHQAYARKNPDNVIDDELLAGMGSLVDDLMSKMAEVEAKRVDIAAVKAETMTVDESIAKYSINLVNYSAALV